MVQGITVSGGAGLKCRKYLSASVIILSRVGPARSEWGKMGEGRERVSHNSRKLCVSINAGGHTILLPKSLKVSTHTAARPRTTISQCTAGVCVWVFCTASTRTRRRLDDFRAQATGARRTPCCPSASGTGLHVLPSDTFVLWCGRTAAAAAAVTAVAAAVALVSLGTDAGSRMGR